MSGIRRNYAENYQPDDMIEIDSLEELAELDHCYTRYLKEAKQDEKKRQA